MKSNTEVVGLDRPTDRDRNRSEVHRLIDACAADRRHAEQVARLALRLFDGTRVLHALAGRARRRLEYAALLHDVGWRDGRKGHHKAALRIILESPVLSFSRRERLMIGLIARYHRKAWPDLRHPHYARLPKPRQSEVAVLAALLRLADGLDRSHRRVATDLAVRVRDDRLILLANAALPPDAEHEAARGKAGLLASLLDRRVVIAWNGA
jgi:exopolyphosphatase/pppGpp-phosphohydrolase